MTRYIALRFLQAIISLLVVMTIVFMLSRLSGDPVQLLADISASEEQMEAIRRDLGLDKPLAVQWGTYVRDMFVFDLGESVTSRQPVRELIMQRLPNTLQLGFAAMAISIVIGLPIGIYAAVHRGTRWDGLARLFAVLGQSMPSFWLGVLLILIFAVVLGVLPPGGKESATSIILPAFSMGYLTTAAIMRLTRSSMLDVLNAEYIKLARIKGLSETKVIWKHALKNSLIPVITFSVVLFTLFLGAAVVTETVFAWPGLGSLILDGVRTRDYPLIQGGVVVFSAIYIMANLLVDILYGYLDPRIRLT
ncbi:MAG: ABC transporter permease [Chloroflexi bacterium]|nr:ABC transporter permease [Chloroflexota bacterium]MYE41464.1 ABC transporter permease [Chloroflexota bacterium]